MTSQNYNFPNYNAAGGLITLAAQGAGTVVSPLQINPFGRGVVVFVDVTVATTASMTVTIEGYDPVSGTAYALLASAAIATTGFTALTVYPGATPASNSVVSAPVPFNWKVSAVITGGSAAVTGTIGAATIV